MTLKTRKQLNGGCIAAVGLILLFGTVFRSAPVRAAERAWFEIRSPHFRVLTNGSEKEGRRVAREFEQMRKVFTVTMPKLKLDGGTPLTVIALQDESSAKSLLPKYWNRKGPKPAGFFSHGWEKSFAMVRLDVLRDEASGSNSGNAFSTVYHEYTHSIMHENFRWLPTWLDEGLAEFYGYTRFTSKTTYVGAPSDRANAMRGMNLIPVSRLLEVKGGDRELREERTVQVFYSEAWGLVHYLIMAPEMDRGARLTQFMTVLNTGATPQEAFREAIGEPREIQDQLDRYIQRQMLDSFVVPNLSETEESAFSSQRLGPLDTGLEVGTFQVWFGEHDAVRLRLEQTVKDFPDSAAAHETMAFLHLHEGRGPEAIREFDRALELDPKRYLSVYYRAMLSPAAKADTSEGRAPLQTALNRVLDLNPQYAPAYVQLAFEYFHNGALDSALVHATKARELAPSRAGYSTLVAHLMHKLGKNSDAAALARFTAERWIGIDRDEAVALWQSLPAEDRQGTTLTPTPPGPDTKPLIGRITSVTCNEKEKTTTVVLDGGMPLTFSTKEEKTTGGLSDTIWAGADHFSSCHNVEGLRAFIEYWPSSSAKVAGELAKFEIRRDLPEFSVSRNK